MKKLSAFLLAGLAAGCATSSDVTKIDSRLGAVEDRQVASDKAVNGAIQHMEQIDRDIKFVLLRVGDIQKKIDALSPPSKPISSDEAQDFLNGSAMDPKVRANLEAFLKALKDMPQDRLMEAAIQLPAENLIPQLMVRVRDPQNPVRANALYVVCHWKSSEAAPLLEPYLSDGSLRGEILKIFSGFEPSDAVRQALLKHANEGTEAWRVMLGDALAKAECRDGIKTLIAFLYSDEATIRSIAIEGLKSATGFDLGYKMYAGPVERRASAEKWEAWWKVNEGQFAFPKR
ncbi:MAG: hypothetical protein K8T20_01815 [Planctomycetes bacterium]|nr:hypothetical protein [Planctomycetota bacterium]